MGVWAILDGAREPAVHLALLASRLEFRCLYSGHLPRELEIVAPQLVELLPGNRLTSTLLDQAWGRSWGVLLKIDDPANLRHHLRKFLRVQDEQGRRLLFRYYDPRVLRNYLPTCTPQELREVFGPIDSFMIESEDGEGVDTFRLQRGELQVRRAAVAATAAP